MPRSHRPRGLKKGQYKRVCDRTGIIHLARDSRTEWSGLIVHKSQFERRNQQEFLVGRRDKQFVDQPRPDTSAVGALDTTTGSVILASGSPVVFTIDLSEEKAISSLTITLTDANLESFRARLVIEDSEDAATYSEVDNVVLNDILSTIESGVALHVPYSAKKRAWRLRVKAGATVALNSTYTVVTTGSDVLSVSY
jgi:hypothetical protein